MKIRADEKGIQAIQQLCDVALKQGGLSNLQGVQAILSSVQELTEDTKKGVDNDNKKETS